MPHGPDIDRTDPRTEIFCLVVAVPIPLSCTIRDAPSDVSKSVDVEEVRGSKLCRPNREKDIHPMRKYVLSILLMTALTGTAMAQQPPAPPPPAPGGPEHVNADRAGPPPVGPEGDMGPRGHRPPPPPPPSKAAHFRIEDGPKVIDIKCADDEPMKACADILSQVLDRMSGPMQPAR